MTAALAKRDLISISDLSKEEIEALLSSAKRFKEKDSSEQLKGKVLASCFFEPSTRTRLSFETAMLRLGGACTGFSDSATTSAQKGETLSDTMQVIGSMADVVVIRHPAEGSARVAAQVSKAPVINAGDGANQHPTQTLLDLFTIRELKGQIDSLHIAFSGDLKYSRTIHSLALGLTHYAPRLYFVSSEELSMPEEISAELRKKSIKFSYHSDWKEILPKLDILYMTRRQLERDSSMGKSIHILKKSHLEQAKPSLKILHPLPRVNEIDRDIDATPFAAYFEQAANGVFVRQAILASILGGTC